ncbi:MAG TPA: ABC transporter permease subunit [Azospirillaceae bacterium]|nr:ABC transporter permease subunit [Azospirillaceae bacterium]
MNFALIWESLPRLLDGAALSLQLTLLALAVGLVLGIALAMLGRNGGVVGRRFVGGYVFVFRGTPLLVQIFLLYYGLGQFADIRTSALWPFLREPFWCAALALSMNTAAYTTEIVRGGIESVPAGQIEAARALGFTRWQIYRLVVFPIALRQALPAYGNEMVLMVKASSLASTITLLEITGIARQIASRTYAPLEIFTAAGLIYLTINTLLARGVRLLEQRLTPHLRPAR